MLFIIRPKVNLLPSVLLHALKEFYKYYNAKKRIQSVSPQYFLSKKGKKKLNFQPMQGAKPNQSFLSNLN